ncbi:MAG: ATP-binding protein [Lachnospiraceae bacterium]|nr:ATP-binding protein [Lachnospiraceae bacterium]
MKAINIYSLTRVSDNLRLSRLEKHMSGRRSFLKIKDWETDGLRRLCDTLAQTDPRTPGYDYFYSFSMPKLGKEFDLLRIGADSMINIELKSGNTSDENILRQLIQNRYYLSAIGKTVWYFTYISDSGRLVRLSNTGRLVESDFGELAHLLTDQSDIYKGDIEELFKEARYLISPLTDPDRFLRGDYFLTFQQRDIEYRLIRDLKYQDKEGNITVRGFSGYPGTGKTLLLYDTAMQLTHRDRVCIIHIGPKTPQLERLNRLLKRIDFYYAGIDLMTIASEKYNVILVDEGHRLTPALWEQIMELAKYYKAPVILSYNSEDAISPAERSESGTALIESAPGFTGYRLTNRIRLSTELSTFIRALMHITESHRRDYPSVSVSYANNPNETSILLKKYKDESYDLIKEPDCEYDGVPVYSSFSREFEQVVMIIDERFYYDDLHYLRVMTDPDTCKALFGHTSGVSNLFHGLSRAKSKIALIIQANPNVFDRILGILQR